MPLREERVGALDAIIGVAAVVVVAVAVAVIMVMVASSSVLESNNLHGVMVGCEVLA